MEQEKIIAATTVLEIALRDILREDLGQTYTVQVGLSQALPQRGGGHIEVRFGAAPENLATMTARVMQEIKRLQKEGPSQDLTNRAKETARRGYETALKQNDYWLGRLQTIKIYDRDPGEILTRGQRIDAVTPQVLQDVFKQYFPADRSTIVTLVPRRGDRTQNAEFSRFLRSANLVLVPGAPAGGVGEHLGEPVAVRQIAPQILKQRDQRIERRADLVGVGGGDVPPDVRRARRQPRRVGEPAAGERQPVLPDRVADDLHQRARGQLRQMAEEREQPIVRLRRSITRGTAPSAAHERGQLVERAPPRRRRLAVVRRSRHGLRPTAGVSSHGRPLNRSGRACSRPPCAAPASGWPPTNVNRGGSDAAACDDLALRAAGVGDDRRLADVLVELRRAARCSVLTGAARITTSASARTMRSSAATSIACSRIAVSSTSLLSTPMTSAVGHSCRAASAIEPPIRPRPTMPIFSKIGGAPDGGSGRPG